MGMMCLWRNTGEEAEQDQTGFSADCSTRRIFVITTHCCYTGLKTNKPIKYNKSWLIIHQENDLSQSLLSEGLCASSLT